jgi:hypothetical protein
MKRRHLGQITKPSSKHKPIRHIITLGDRVTVTPDDGNQFIGTVVGFAEGNWVMVKDRSGNVTYAISFQVSDAN